MLPKVSKELIHTTIPSYADEERIKEGWREMAMENLELFKFVAARSRLCDTIEESQSFLKGAFLVRDLLLTQSEVDDMNRYWSV